MLEDRDELLDGTGGAVEALDDYEVELPLRGVRQESSEVSPILPRPRGDVAVGRDQHPALSLRVLPDLRELNVKVLPVGADSEIGSRPRDGLVPTHVTRP